MSLPNGALVSEPRFVPLASLFVTFHRRRYSYTCSRDSLYTLLEAGKLEFGFRVSFTIFYHCRQPLLSLRLVGSLFSGVSRGSPKRRPRPPVKGYPHRCRVAGILVETSTDQPSISFSLGDLSSTQPDEWLLIQEFGCRDHVKLSSDFARAPDRP